MKNQPSKESSSWLPMLEARIVRNSSATALENEIDRVTLSVTRIRPGYLVPPISWVVPFSPEKKIVLDGIGATVWRLCDGSRTVEQVIDVFREKYSLTFHEARVAVTDYLRKLIRQGVLAVVMRENQ